MSTEGTLIPAPPVRLAISCGRQLTFT